MARYISQARVMLIQNIIQLSEALIMQKCLFCFSSDRREAIEGTLAAAC